MYIMNRYYLQYSLEIFINKNGNSRRLMKTSLYNYCLYTKKNQNRGNSIVEMVVQQILRNSTLPRNGCPVPAGKYYINDFGLDGTKFPSFVPSGKYIAYWYLWTIEKKVKLIILQLGLEIKATII